MNVNDDIEIDQINCLDCGRPIIVRCDVELTEDRKRCHRCKAGLTPEWEY